jgi:hypothetical protein
VGTTGKGHHFESEGFLLFGFVPLRGCQCEKSKSAGITLSEPESQHLSNVSWTRLHACKTASTCKQCASGSAVGHRNCMSRVPIRLNSPSKYRATRTEGYASRKEARRASELELLEHIGGIRSLQKQVSFELIPRDGTERAIVYRADFIYEERSADGHWIRVVEDVKGVCTPVYKLKRRLMLWLHGIRIHEI